VPYLSEAKGNLKPNEADVGKLQHGSANELPVQEEYTC